MTTLDCHRLKKPPDKFRRLFYIWLNKTKGSQSFREHHGGDALGSGATVDRAWDWLVILSDLGEPWGRY